MEQHMDENALFEMDDRSFEREIEALLFASDTPLSAAKLAALTGAASSRRVLSAIGALSSFYRDSGRSYTIVEVAGGYQLTTLPEFSGTVSRLFKGKKKAKLTQPALEALAIVAYKQPISRMQIEAIRGVSCEGVLATLMDRELISISGRGDGIGKPFLYSTTKKFLEYLGLKDFRDLPSFEELERRFAMDAATIKPLVPPPGSASGESGEERMKGQ
jgi:segregation and condensation protein B